MLISSLWYCGATGEAIKRRSVDFCTIGLVFASLIVIVELSLQIKSCWYFSDYNSNAGADDYDHHPAYNFDYPPSYPPYANDDYFNLYPPGYPPYANDDHHFDDDYDDDYNYNYYLDDYYYPTQPPTDYYLPPYYNTNDDWHYHDDHSGGYYHEHHHSHHDDDYNDFVYDYTVRRNNKRLLMPYIDFLSSAATASAGDSNASVPSYEGVAIFALALSVLSLLYALVGAAIPIYTDGLTTPSSRTGTPRRCNAIVQLVFAAVFSVSWFVAACLTTYIGPFTAAGNGYFAVWGAFACSVSTVLILKKQI